jgi:hypothetical protein
MPNVRNMAVPMALWRRCLDEAMSPLRRRMSEDMAIRKLAPKTQRRRSFKCSVRNEIRASTSIDQHTLPRSKPPVHLQVFTIVLDRKAPTPPPRPPRSNPHSARHPVAPTPSRGFLPWRFSCAATARAAPSVMRPASENLRSCGHSDASCALAALSSSSVAGVTHLRLVSSHGHEIYREQRRRASGAPRRNAARRRGRPAV